MKQLAVALLFASIAGAQALPAGVVYWPKGVPPATALKAELGDHILSTSVHDGKPGVAESHTLKDDVFLIQSGSSDFVVGGKTTGEHAIAPNELQYASLQGGTKVHLEAGDVITIPAGMPHQYLTAPGEKIVYFVLKVVKTTPVATPAKQQAGLPTGVLHWKNGIAPEGLSHRADFGDHILYRAHRDKSGVVEFHEKQDDVLIMEKGEADILVGGTAAGLHATKPGEQEGTAINGATKVHLGPGDVITVPAKMPHQMLLQPGATLDYFIMKIVKPA